MQDIEKQSGYVQLNIIFLKFYSEEKQGNE
jgi:hypothetical protein